MHSNLHEFQDSSGDDSVICNRQTDGRIDGQTDGLMETDISMETDGLMDRQMD